MFCNWYIVFYQKLFYEYSGVERLPAIMQNPLTRQKTWYFSWKFCCNLSYLTTGNVPHVSNTSLSVVLICSHIPGRECRSWINTDITQWHTHWRVCAHQLCMHCMPQEVTARSLRFTNSAWVETRLKVRTPIWSNLRVFFKSIFSHSMKVIGVK
jgi:hypothetical protein